MDKFSNYIHDLNNYIDKNLSFNDPVGIYHADDSSDRLFVIEQTGKIKVFNKL